MAALSLSTIPDDTDPTWKNWEAGIGGPVDVRTYTGGPRRIVPFRRSINLGAVEIHDPATARFFDVRGTFDGDAARDLSLALHTGGRECVIDFAHAADVKLHALGALLLGFDGDEGPVAVRLRGLTSHHLSIVRSFGYVIDAEGRLARSPGPTSAERRRVAPPR